MGHVEIIHSKEPIRLFKSDVLEFFTHISPIAILVIWIPVVIYFLVLAFNISSPFEIIFGYLFGLIFWTFAEYGLHRFLFHFKPRAPWQERVSFLMHGVHHAQPTIKTRLVMPPPVSVPLAALFYGAFVLILGVILPLDNWVKPLFAGFITGYVLYDMTHYALHHIRWQHPYMKSLRRYHMLHHSQTPNQRYGVTSPLWDRVFGTMPGWNI